MIRIIVAIAKGVKDGVIDTFKSIATNFEAVSILSLAAIGLTAVLRDLPFRIAIPMWIEGTFIMSSMLPVISVLIITILVIVMQKRLSLKEA